MRTGLGYDIHRLVPTEEKQGIPLAGVILPCFFKVEAHSDGDVLYHAVTDALLGALALGDIGQWFPDTRPENKGRASVEFVQEVWKKVESLGYRILNLDAIIYAEVPKIAPHSDSIRQSLSKVLNTELTNVSLKAKTMEGLGPIGEKRAIAAQVSLLLEESK